VPLPVDNAGFVQALAAGLLDRPIYEWPDKPGRPGPEVVPGGTRGRVALLTEVAYLQLGDLSIAAIPGEIYPECVYGKYQDPVEPGADFPEAPLETAISDILPSKKILVLGLANDEVGYIIPKRQWDVAPPFAYNRKSAQYGERNSVGPDTARLLLEALADRVAASQLKQRSEQ